MKLLYLPSFFILEWGTISIVTDIKEISVLKTGPHCLVVM